MTIEKQLKQGGQTIKQQADARLSDWDVNQSVMQGINAELNNNQPVSHQTRWYAVAAAITTCLIIWALNTADNTQFEHFDSTQQLSENSIELQLKQLPLALEQKVNQPLINEQQAILKDLETLKAQLLSI